MTWAKGERQAHTRWTARIIVAALSVFVAAASNLSAQSDQKMSIGILMDNTGSMRNLMDEQQKIAKAIIKYARAESPLSLFGFAQSGKPVPGGSARFAAGTQCSTDRTAFAAQIDSLGTVGGQTTLRDAIQSAVQILHNPGGQACRDLESRILVIMTDGEDRASSIHADQLIEFVKARKVKLYVIGLLRGMGPDSGFISKSPREKSKDFLMKLVKDTGGRVVFPKDSANAEKVVAELFSDAYVLPK